MPVHGNVIVSAFQIRMARAGLGWTVQELADRAGLSSQTIRRIESAKGTPQTTVQTMESIVSCLENHGMVFMAADERSEGPAMGAGVRMRYSKFRTP